VAYRLRYLRQEDIAQVTEIDLACFPTMMPVPNYLTELSNPLAHYIVLADDSLVSAERSGTTIPGFSGIWMMAGEAHVINIAVRPERRQEGWGELLFIGLFQLARRLKAIMLTLEVRVSNKAAQQLYAKYGLTERGCRRAYYTDNREDALIMTLDDPGCPAYDAALSSLRQEYTLRWRRETELESI